MSNQNTQKFQVSIAELDRLLNLFEKLIDGVSKATRLTKDQRHQMRQSIGDTCEMVDLLLTAVKQHISHIIREMRAGNLQQVKNEIIELNNMDKWEHQYRAFQLCESLRTAGSEIRDGILGRFVSFFSFRDPDELRGTIESFLETERVAGEFIARLLYDLAQLHDEVDERPDFVLTKLEEARTVIQQYRDRFIELEKRMRAAI